MINMLVMGEYRLLLFGNMPNLKKKYGSLTFLLTPDHIDSKFQNVTPTVFIQSQPNFMRTLATMANTGYCFSRHVFENCVAL